MEAERVASAANHWSEAEYTEAIVTGQTAGSSALAPVAYQVAAALPAATEQTAWAEPRGAYGRYGKRMLDVAMAIPLLVMAAPIIFIIALAIRVTSGAPIFHKAKRVGLNGREFTMWKLRTMVPDAEKVLEDWRVNNPELAAAYFTDYKLANDPRITTLGRFLRKSSLDELPQLWNVLRGDMSLVGPRPIVREELSNYGVNVSDFLSVRPGITGFWQTDGRNDIRYPERSWFELTYCRTYCLTTDLKILFRTLGTPLRFNG